MINYRNHSLLYLEGNLLFSNKYLALLMSRTAMSTCFCGIIYLIANVPGSVAASLWIICFSIRLAIHKVYFQILNALLNLILLHVP